MNRVQKLSIVVSLFLLLGYNIMCENNNENLSLNVNDMLSSTNSGIATGVEDGTYSGSGRGFKGNTVVEVVIKNEQIKSIEIKSYKDDKNWFKRAKTKVITGILTKQSVEVDSVAGATYSSKGIMKAVNDALENAKQ